MSDMSVTKRVALPIIYEEAVRDLIACQTLDEAKYFADKADALAAWAKIYKSDRAGIESKKLKLHAYRRMGTLAAEIQPRRIKAKWVRDPSAHRGGTLIAHPLPGPQALLESQGFSHSKAETIRSVAKLDEATFEALLALPHPPSPHHVRQFMAPGVRSVHYKTMRHWMGTFLSLIRKTNAADAAAKLAPDEAERIRPTIIEMQEWLDTFERFLPKEVT